MRPIKGVAMLAGLGVVLAIGTAAASGGGQSESNRPDFATKPATTGTDRAHKVVTSLMTSHAGVGGLTTAISHIDAAASQQTKATTKAENEESEESSKPSFAGTHETTGLDRAQEVLTALVAAHPDAEGLTTALAHVTANNAAHATGHGAGEANSNEHANEHAH